MTINRHRALLGSAAGTALFALAVPAQADQLQDIRAQIAALDAHVAAMEAAPALPQGYRLLAVSAGEQLPTPGADDSTRERFSEGSRATIISVLPTADAPAGTKISWSGYVRAAIVYTGNDETFTAQAYRNIHGSWVKGTRPGDRLEGDVDINDWDVKARGQLRVKASTDTAVGTVGLDLKMRADFNGNGTGSFYLKTAWGYWAMTPELTFGGGYNESLAKIEYGYDGACVCYYTDNADVDFDPGDVSQLRLSYGSGPFSMAVAVEDGGKNNGFGQDNYKNSWNQLGVAGRIKYSGDVFAGEISGVYRGTRDDAFPEDSNIDGLWQVGAGVEFSLGDIATLSLAAAMGEGPFETVNDSGDITREIPYNQSWWGVSGLASATLSDSVHAEVGAGYKNRQGDSFTYDKAKSNGVDYDTWAVLGGLYYDPVDQLTIGLEAEYYQTNQSWTASPDERTKTKYTYDQDNWTVDLVSVWRF